MITIFYHIGVQKNKLLMIMQYLFATQIIFKKEMRIFRRGALSPVYLRAMTAGLRLFALSHTLWTYSLSMVSFEFYVTLLLHAVHTTD